MSKTTIVSGYWSVKGKHSNEKFDSWFKNTLRINCPYIFFGNKESIETAKRIRFDLPTEYVLLELDDFYTNKYKNHIAEHKIHVPSPEVCLIWLEKIFLLQKAKEMNTFNSDYFMWVDAGICVLRNQSPPSEKFTCEKINLLPKNKFIFTSSEEPFDNHCVHSNNYYHYISATAFILHIDFIDEFTEIYKTFLDRFINHYNWVNTEQKILTHMFSEKPELFFKLGEGYGNLLWRLY